MMVIFNVKLRDTLVLLEPVFLLSVYIRLIYSLLQKTGLYWIFLQKATQFSKQRNGPSLQMSIRACCRKVKIPNQIQYTYKFNWKKEGDLLGAALPIINMSWV